MRISVRYGLLGLVLTAATLPVAAAGSGQFKDLLNKVKQSTHTSNSSQLGSNLPSSDIAAGLKEALAKGTTNAINSLGRDGGFWNNSKVRIPLPGKLEQAGKLARQLGQGAKVDAFELSMNRAAEKAVPQVAEIFGDAIRKMTLSDARGILTGGDHAATDFFRRVAGDALTAVFRYSTTTRRSTTRRAVQCALDMQADMVRFRVLVTRAGHFRLAMKVGLAAGPLLQTVMGNPAVRLGYLLVGPAVERAAAAEHHARGDEVVVDDGLLAHDLGAEVVERDGRWWLVRGLRKRASPARQTARRRS